MSEEKKTMSLQEWREFILDTVGIANQIERENMRAEYKREMAEDAKRTRNPEAVCGKCPYWEAEECRRTPPIRQEHGVLRELNHPYPNVTYKSKYPRTASDQWCGEHPSFWLTDGGPHA